MAVGWRGRDKLLRRKLPTSVHAPGAIPHSAFESTSARSAQWRRHCHQSQRRQAHEQIRYVHGNYFQVSNFHLLPINHNSIAVSACFIHEWLLIRLKMLITTYLDAIYFYSIAVEKSFDLFDTISDC